MAVKCDSVSGLDALIAEMDGALAQVSSSLADITSEPDYILEKLKVDFLHEVGLIMEQRKISGAELARRMGVSRARVAKILNDTSNFQMGTMARIAAALNCKMSLGLTQCGPDTDWQTISAGTTETLNVTVRVARVLHMGGTWQSEPTVNGFDTTQVNVA